MSEKPILTVLGTGTKRLTRRKRTQRRGPRRVEVLPSVRQPDLATPIYGCQTDIFEGTLLAEKPEEIVVHVTRQEKEIILAQARRRLKNLPSLIIENISYTVMSHEELQEMAVFKVRKTDEEGLHTVNDPRSGVVDNDKVCRTCLADNLTCPGHLGMIELNQPIIHPMFRREIIDILAAVCNSCGGLLLPRDLIEEKGILNLTGSKRLRALAEASKKVHCRRSKENMAAGTIGCIPNPVYKASKVKEVGKIFYSYDGKKGKDNVRTVEEIEQILNAISDEDSTIMGFDNRSHPNRFIMRSIPVIPICARAPVIQDGLILKDDITSMYLDIVRYNQELLREDLAENEREKIVRGLIFSIEHMFDNSDNRYRQGKMKPYLDIKGRIQGKEAIIRNLIQGKRVNYSARTVLGPDPNLKFGQIRLPQLWAPYLTYPEIVSPSNIGRLTRLFRAGRITHITPGRGKLEGRRLKVTKRVRTQQNLTFGDTVDRWLQNGDRVAFNRQPTLHKQGFMGYEVVLAPPLTIGMHLSYTPPHNADFDGDEGTIHAPQSREAMLEVALLMGVKHCIMNAQNNKNIIGVVMDALTGAYLMTQPETFIDPSVFMNIVSFIENTSGRDTFRERLDSYYIPMTSGRALFSSILPENFYYRKGDVLIRDGILVSGILTKDHIGSSHGSIIQVLMKDYGVDTTVNFLTDVYNIMKEWLDVRGFSIGLDDCFLAGDDPEKSIEYEVQRAKMLVRSMGWKLTDPLEEERREKQIIAYLNTAKGLGARISDQNLPPSNAFNVMAKSGAKGSTFNIAQITGMLGQQFVQGQRMPEAISDGTRCLPYFPQNSLDPAARGFCSNSFLTGLSPAEMFFHQAGGREGLTDTAIKSVTGDTPIVIIENGKPRRVKIGDWIDNLMSENPDIEHYDDRDMELLRINGVSIPTVDEDGIVSWGDITAVTRHDPGKKLYRVKTLGGRKVTVTESHSLLIWNRITKKFERTSTPKVNIGDFMPTTITLPKVEGTKYNFDNLETLFAAPKKDIVNVIKDYFDKYGEKCRFGAQMIMNSVSMLETINMLLSRFGIFGIITGNCLLIKSQWYKRFCVKILNEWGPTIIYTDQDFHVQNNVVLDQIVSIEEVDVKLYPKVYDLTVPSTLNFGLANGLHVVDTAETGSMHHRVVKALEDVKVYFDGSARNAFGVIFQYTYGEDGFDASMLETVSTKTGRFTSFINTKRLAGRINARYGYATPGDPDPEEIIPIPHRTIRAARIELAEGELPPVPRLAPLGREPTRVIEIGDVVHTAGGDGVVQQVEGERVLVETEGQQPAWVKIEKLEL